MSVATGVVGTGEAEPVEDAVVAAEVGGALDGADDEAEDPVADAEFCLLARRA
jgi:hypothetical protein